MKQRLKIREFLLKIFFLLFCPSRKEKPRYSGAIFPHYKNNLQLPGKEAAGFFCSWPWAINHGVSQTEDCKGEQSVSDQRKIKKLRWKTTAAVFLRVKRTSHLHTGSWKFSSIKAGLLTYASSARARLLRKNSQ